MEIHDYEVDQLIIWHMDEQYRAADKQDYDEAKDHQRRVGELRDLMKKRAHDREQRSALVRND